MSLKLINGNHSAYNIWLNKAMNFKQQKQLFVRGRVIMGGFYSRRHNVGQRVYPSELRIGMLIHLSSTNFGCVWKIVSIEPVNSRGEIWLNLVAPESGRSRRSNAIYARHIRRNERF